MRVYLSRALIVLIAIVFTWAASELALTLVMGRPTPSGPSGLEKLYIYDSTLGWAGKPNVSSRFQTPRFDTFVRHNSRGFREREIPYEKPANTYRIIVLGDSYMWGWGVQEEERLSNVVEQTLTQRGHSVQVINLGHQGYGTDQEYLLLSREGIKYSPNLVLLALTLHTDLTDNSLSFVYGSRFKPHFELDAGNKLRLTNVPVPFRPQSVPAQPSPLQSVKDWLNANLVSYRLLANLGKRVSPLADLLQRLGLVEKPGQRASGDSPERNPQKDYFPLWSPVEQRKALDITLALVLQLASIAKEGGADLLVVLVPSPTQLLGPDNEGRAFDSASETLQAGLAGKVPVLDLKPVFGAVPQPESLHIRGDGHWNSQGHRIAAASVADYVEQNMLKKAGKSPRRAAASDDSLALSNPSVGP